MHFILLHRVSFSCHVSVILIVVSVCTATGAWNWLIDPDTQKVCIRGQVCLILSFLAQRDITSLTGYTLCSYYYWRVKQRAIYISYCLNVKIITLQL